LYNQKCKQAKYYAELELCDAVKVMVNLPEQPHCSTGYNGQSKIIYKNNAHARVNGD
jgi:hypothetical protein